MKALVYVAPERMEIQDLPAPEAAEGQVLLRVAATGICGSDVHGFLGHSARRKPGLVLGHEAVCIIADKHAAVRDWSVGQRVVVNPLDSCGTCAACMSGRQNLCENWSLLGLDRVQGTYAEFVAVPAKQVYALSDTLADEEAVFAEPLANIVHFFRTTLSEIPDSLTIFGAGPIGMLALALARLRGISQVCVIDRVDQRLEIARRLNADCVINSAREDAAAAVKKFCPGGTEVVIDAVGVDATRRAAVASCRRGGRIVLIGMGDNEGGLPWIDLIRDEKSLLTTFAYTPRDFQTSLALLESRRLNLSAWSEVRPLEDGQASFTKMAHNPGGTLKLIFRVG